MADIFTEQVYVEKVYLRYKLKPTMRNLEKDNDLEMLEISVLFFLQKIDKQLLLFECLTVSLDKIKKNYFENDESFQFSKYWKKSLYTNICKEENDKIS